MNLQSLETKIDELIKISENLVAENKTLRQNRAELMSERDTLLEKNALACSRIEDMIARLKSMEISL
ncbi:TIGR02449 family protein [Candidatus Halobeggiatoa sp. HSG11]|nr:TIGR02449 family protein [Candidatus Halobeggiatoa sp. HSG11]